MAMMSSIAYLARVLWCFWSFRPSSPLRLSHPKCYVMLYWVLDVMYLQVPGIGSHSGWLSTALLRWRLRPNSTKQCLQQQREEEGMWQLQHLLLVLRLELLDTGGIAPVPSLSGSAPGHCCKPWCLVLSCTRCAYFHTSVILDAPVQQLPLVEACSRAEPHCAGWICAKPIVDREVIMGQCLPCAALLT